MKPHMGHRAVTIESRGHEFQVVPVVKVGKKTYIPSETGDKWTDVDIHAFDRRMHSLNKRTDGNLSEAIRFVKAYMDEKVPARYRLSGYHIENMACEAIRNHKSCTTTTQIVRKTLSYIPGRLMMSTLDTTGESQAIDTELGHHFSKRRKEFSRAYSDLRDSFENDVQGDEMR